jgi:hypothetical protein
VSEPAAPPDETAEVLRARPDAFVATRDEVVRRLRDAGRDDDAAAVKALRKPTLVVWALNQLSVRAPDRVAALLDAGRELRASQQATLTKGDPARLRTATEDRRRIVRDLVDVVVAALGEVGSATVAQADQVAAALESASIDPTTGERLAAGTLATLPREPAGFGDVFGITGVPGGRSEPIEGSKPTDLRSRTAEVTRLRRERDRIDKQAAASRERATSLARERDDLRARLREVEAAHEEAVHAANASDTDLRRTERALAKAEASLERRSG